MNSEIEDFITPSELLRTTKSRRWKIAADEYSLLTKNLCWRKLAADEKSRKFPVESPLGKDSIRLTFQSWQDVILLQQGASNRSGDFTETMLNHWNILGPGASTPLEFPKYRLSIPDTEVTRPDVFIMNPATAYSLFKQTEPVSSWVWESVAHLPRQAFRSYVKSFADMMNHSSSSKGSPHIFWYHAPFLFGTAHEGTEFITQTRNERFSRIAQYGHSKRLQRGLKRLTSH